MLLVININIVFMNINILMLLFYNNVVVVPGCFNIFVLCTRKPVPMFMIRQSMLA